MPSMFRLVDSLPIPYAVKSEWRRVLLDKAYAKDIEVARKAKDSEKVDSLERSHRYEIQLTEEEDDIRLTKYLLRNARRLRVPIPRTHNDNGAESDDWYEGCLTYSRLLTTKGAAAVRDEIRKERKARHESRSIWIPWLCVDRCHRGNHRPRCSSRKAGTMNAE